MWVTSAVTARLKSGHDNKLAQIQEKKERRNQKESEGVKHVAASPRGVGETALAKLRDDRRPPDTHTPVCPPTCSALVPSPRRPS